MTRIQSALLHLLFAILPCVALGCSTTVNMVPADANLAPGQEVRIENGNSAKLMTIDERPVNGTLALIAPGKHVVHFEVRRNLRKVGLPGVFFDGECEIEIETEPGQSIGLRVLVGSETIDAKGKDNDYLGSTITSFKETVHIVNLDTNESQQLSASSCQTRQDCRRLDTNLVTPSSSCAYGNRPPFER